VLKNMQADVLQGYFRMERFIRAIAGDGGASFAVPLEPAIALSSTDRNSLPGMTPVSDRLGQRWTGVARPGASSRTGGLPPPGQARTGMMSRALRPDLLPTRSRGLAAQPRSAGLRTSVSRRGTGGATHAAAHPGVETQVRATQLSSGQVRIIGSGRALADDVRRPLERFFDADLSTVRVHEGLAAGSIGAMAFTLGDAIYFAPGRYDPRSREGLRLLGHEVAHVVQQRQGRVVNPFGGGIAIVQDPSLEAEADRIGHHLANEFGRVTGRASCPARSNHAGDPAVTRTARTVRCVQLMEDMEKEDNVVGRRVIVEGMKSTGYVIEKIKDLGYKVGFSRGDRKGALYLEGSVTFVDLGSRSLVLVGERPEGPYLRINSFAFARSGSHPIGSDSYGSCLGVVVHDRRRSCGALAHIDTDYLDGVDKALERKAMRIAESIIAMLISLNPLHNADLEVILFAGVGLRGLDDHASFKERFALHLPRMGLAVEQIAYHFETDHNRYVSMGVYAPATGELYLHPGWSKLGPQHCHARVDYGKKTDYEDQDEVKERIEEEKVVIVEVVFDETGKEVQYKEYYRGGYSYLDWVGHGKGDMEWSSIYPKKDI
jgi:hypothetical protein